LFDRGAKAATLMTLVDAPIVQGHVILPGLIVTADVAGHRVRLHVTHVDGQQVEGVELRRHTTPILRDIQRAGGLLFTDSAGKVWARCHLRTVPADSIVTIHRTKDIDG
jgi:hypothetical protein